MQLHTVIPSLIIAFLQLLHRVHASEYVLIVCFHGFRWDYLQHVKTNGHLTPNFDAIEASGVKADYMQSAFVTLSRPNLWTLATGLHVESHGIVSEHFYDLALDDHFTEGTRDDAKWYGGIEPVWVTYESASRDHHAALLGWPGAEVPGFQATYSVPENHTMTARQLVDQMVQWFTSDESPAHLGLMYMDEPGRTGQLRGLASGELKDAILEVDELLGYLIQTLREHELLSATNLLLLGDHGMTDALETYALTSYIHPDLYVLSGDSPNHMLMPKQGAEEQVYAALQQVPHGQVYRKEEIPEHLHYRHHARILPLLLAMEPGYATCCSNGSQPRLQTGQLKASGGYDPSVASMRPFFMAQGPGFKSQYASPAFNSTDLYPLLCHMLGVAARESNGSIENIRHMLAHPPLPPIPDLIHLATRFSTAIITFIIMLLLSCVVATCYFLLLRKAEPRTPRSLCVDLPDSHPTYKMARMAGDRQWLLNNNGGESESDIEEWQPLRTRQDSVQAAGEDQQDQTCL